MLRYLTQKLQSQSISEVSPASTEQSDLADDFPCQVLHADDKEQGMDESDGENAEICSIIEGSSKTSGVEKNQENQPGSLPPQQQPQQRAPLRPVQPDNAQVEEPMVESEDGASEKPGLAQEKLVHGVVSEEGATSGQVAGEPSPCTCAEAPASSLAPVMVREGRSSTEELEMINCCVREGGGAEKRKWAMMAGGSSSSSGGSSTTDEEVQDLTSSQPLPVNFSGSPPQGLSRFVNKVSPLQFLASVAPAVSSPTHLWSSPRKRQRQFSDMPTGQRPFLDLEKMQKSFFKQRYSPHSASKAKIVKIKTVSGSRNSPKCAPDPAIFSFRSISTNHLTPVEEPLAF